MNNFLDKLLEFGSLSVKRLCKALFVTGFIALLIKSFMFGYMVYQTNTYMKTIRDANFFTGVEVNNFPLGLFCGLAYLIIGTFLWRLICEIIYIVLRYFKNNTNLSPNEKNKNKGDAQNEA